MALLTAPVAGNPAADSDRLAALVDGYIQQSDAAYMASALEQLQTQYPQSQAYAAALSSAGNFFVRQGDWASALKYYEPLAQQFPERDFGREGHWRVAWGYHLQRQSDQARRCLIEHVSRYPTSAHIPAALYWLARLEDERGPSPTARVLYEFLTKRYPYSYYALQARARLREGSGKQASATQPESATPDPAVGDLVQKIPAVAALPIQPCTTVAVSELLGPFETLQVLSLADLAGEYLKDTLAAHPDSPDLYLAASRAEAEAGQTSVAIFTARKLAPDPAEYEFSTVPKEVWSLLYPRPFWDLVRRQARASQLDPYLVMGLIRQESTFNPMAISSADARGLMQLLPRTAARVAHRKRGVGRRIYDPAFNIRLGCAYFAGLLKMFGGGAEQALAAYNAGDSRVTAWLNQRQYSEPAEFAETIPFRETRLYVQAVLRDAEIYRQLLTGKAQFAACEAGGPAR